jgi:hypothetical protein
MKHKNFAILERLEDRQLLSGSHDLPLGLISAPDSIAGGLVQPPDAALAAPAIDPLAALHVRLNGRGRTRFSAIISHSAEVDSFELSPVQDGILRVWRWSGRAQVNLAAYDDQGDLLTDSGSSGEVNFKVQAGRSYYINASGREGSTGRYRLRVNTTPDDYADTMDRAAMLRLTEAGAGSLRGRVEGAGDVDFLQFQAPLAGQVSLTQPGGWGVIIADVIVYDGQGNVVADNTAVSAQQKGQLDFQAAQGQTYYLRMSAGPATTGSYRLSVSTHQVPVPPTPDTVVVIQPGQAVTAQQVIIGGHSQLLILGTDSVDSVMVSQSGMGTTVTSSAGNRTFSESFESVVMYGFGGDDTIKVDYSVSLPVSIFAGDGNDRVFCAGKGADAIDAGAGDDFVVTVGSGADNVAGGDGLDSFWVDGADIIADASAAEQAATSVHTVQQFYQPYTTSPGGSGYVPLDIRGQNLADPLATTDASGWRNFSANPVFVNGAAYSDIRQGYIGDCYYLASLASLAQSDPGLIEQSVAPLGDGTFAVRFYRSGQPVYVRVDGDLPVGTWGGPVYAQLGQGGELWAALAEKAFAYFRNGSNTYASINGGWMSEGYRVLTGKSVSQRSPAALGADLYNWVATELSAGHALSMGSFYYASGPIVGSHAYMIQSVSVQNGQQYITVYNPWGEDGVAYDSNPGDGLIKLTVDQVVQYFSAIQGCYA